MYEYFICVCRNHTVFCLSKKEGIILRTRNSNSKNLDYEHYVDDFLFTVDRWMTVLRGVLNPPHVWMSLLHINNKMISTT